MTYSLFGGQTQDEFGSNLFGSYSSGSGLDGVSVSPAKSSGGFGGLFGGGGGGGDSFLGMSSGGWQGMSGAIGGLASSIGGGSYSSGTQGSFTAMGTAIMPGWGTLVGAVLDIGVSMGMGNSAEEKAREAADEYWASAYKEMESFTMQQRAVRGEVVARQGTTNATLESPTLVKYRKVLASEQKKAWDAEYTRHAEEYKKIRSGG